MSNRDRRRACLVWQGLILGAALLSPSAQADEPPLQINQYAHSAWTAREGWSLGLVFAITQTPDGYLWLGGSFGLYRFDGLQFTLWQPPVGQSLPDKPYSLLVSRDGKLWIGTFKGLSSWDGRTLTHYPALKDAFVTSLLEDHDGTLWVGTLGHPGQLCTVRSGEARCDPADAAFGGFVWSLAEDRDGVIWAGAESGMWRWRPGPPQRYELPDARAGDLITDVNGRLLFGLRGAGLRQLAGDQVVPLPVPLPTRQPGTPGGWMSERAVQSNKLLRDREGSLWIGTEGRGLIHLQDGRADTYSRADGLSGNIACALFQDREGNIWYSSEKGLDRFHKLPVTTLSTPQGLPAESTNAVLATRDGSVWVATIDGLARRQGERTTVYRERDGLPSARVQSLHEDADGRLWVSTFGGLARWSGQQFTAVEDLPDKEIFSMTSDTQGNLWLSGHDGLARLRQGRLVERLPWPALGRQQQAKVLVADRGGVWLAFWAGGGVMYLKDGRVQAEYGAAQGLGAGHVAGLRLGSDGAVWAATEDGGLSRLHEGRVATLSTANGLPCNTIHWSAEDAQGGLWMLGACGLLHLPREDLSAWLAEPGRRVVPRQWGAADGVPLHASSAAYFNPPVTRAADGRLWFVTGNDVQVLDPERMPSNPLPPPVHVLGLVADRQAYVAAAGLQLPPHVHDLTIEYAALSLVDPKNTHFRYQLEGHDEDWQDVVGRRVASYSNLPPGRYRFRVKAANNSGVWNEDGAQLEFSIQPALYQTAAFRVAAVLLLAGAGLGGLQLWLQRRVRRLRREFEATLEARVAERTRIARDLHDTLLQRFHGLLLQIQAASNLLPQRAAESKQVLARTIHQAAEAITEGRDTVQGLRNAVPDGSDGLADALRALVADLAQEHGPVPTVLVEALDAPRALQPVVRDEAFRIAAEALRNAFRHAGAKQVSVAIQHQPRGLRLCVRDDGQGIPPDMQRSGGRGGHFGLSGMRERAALAGGQLALISRPGQGTDVEFVVPAAKAYRRPPPGQAGPLSRWFGTRESGA